jgi:hypothetical protein
VVGVVVRNVILSQIEIAFWMTPYPRDIV